MIEKPYREENKKYLKYIRTLPCACQDHTCVGDICPHHTISVGARGADLRAVPLCARHHHEVHFRGRETFQKEYSVDFRDVIIRNLTEYINKIKTT